MTEGLTMIDAYVCRRVGKFCVCVVCVLVLRGKMKERVEESVWDDGRVNYD